MAPTASPRDRRAALMARSDVNGIDFVEIASASQTTLQVHFLNPQPAASVLQPSVTEITIAGGEATAAVKVRTKAWSDTPGGPLLTLSVDAAGDFSTYTLTVKSPLLDVFFDHVAFSFKALCPSPVNCGPAAEECPPSPFTAPPIDYLAKDFESFKKALSDFSAQRYPEWQERSEADFGVMFMEALASLGDDLSYLQDRIAAEAWLETATQRRSLVRHARLVNYEPRVATAAQVTLQFNVASAGWIAPGIIARALSPDGITVDFETGTGMSDPNYYPANPAWNSDPSGRLVPYWLDDSERCLRRGATEMWIDGVGLGLQKGQLLLIDTPVAGGADPPVREVVQLTTAPLDTLDPIYNKPVTHIVWRAEDALQFDHDLSQTRIAGNLVPATQGRRYADTFITAVDQPPPQSPQRAIVRTGANGTRQFFHTLQTAPLAWLASDPGAMPLPEIQLTQRNRTARSWRWQRTLIGAPQPDDASEHYTLDPVRYSAMTTPGSVDGMADYDGGDGDTIRFGDGVFGAIPDAAAIFDVKYRVGGGSRGNVAAASITLLDPSSLIAALPRYDAGHQPAAQVTGVTNPFAAQGGADAEPAERVREMAPQAFRAKQFRAVLKEDYEQAAETLPWVQRAGTSFRYTGSWLTVFTAVDPVGSESLPDDKHAEFVSLLNRYRLAGYEAYGVPPRYASIDLSISVCARPDAFRGDVTGAVLTALDASVHADGTTGFFHRSHFTFGVPLDRSALEAAIQEVPGVDGVVDIQYRRRGFTRSFVRMLDTVPVANDEVLRVNNDPSRPERGSLRIYVQGGK